MRTKLTSVISLLVATILVLGTLFSSCAPAKKESEATKCLNKIFEATFAGVEVPEPQVTTSKLTFNNTADIGIPHFVGGEMTLMTGKSGESALVADVTLDSGKIDLSVYNAGTTVILGSSAIGSTMYGMELSDAGTLLGGLMGSLVPGQSLPSPVASEDAAISGLLGSLSGIGSLLDANNAEKVYSLLEKYAKIIANAAESTCESKVDTGDDVNVTVEFNTDSAKKLIKDVFSELKKDNGVKTLVESVLVSGGMSKEDAKDQISAIFSDETVKSVYDTLDAAPFALKVEVNANKDYILEGISVQIKSQGATTKVFFDASAEGKIELGISTSVTFEGIAYKQEYKLVLENKTVDGADVFKVDLITTLNGNAMADTLFKSEVKGGKYAVTVRVPDETSDAGYYDMTLGGEMTTDGNKSQFTIDTATAFGNTLNVDLKIETEVGGTMPEFPTEFKNILQVTGDEFNTIMNNLKNSPLGQFIPQNGGAVVLPDVNY